MDTDRLREYVRVVETGSVTRAAGLIGVSQPTLSKHMADLEGAFGVRLLERLPGGVRPTAAGRVLYDGAADVLNRVGALEADMRSLRGVAQRQLNLGCYLGYGPTDDLIASASELLRHSMPGVLVNIVDMCRSRGDLLNELQDGTLDACITAAPAQIHATGIARSPLLSDRLVLVARTDGSLAGRGHVSPDAIKGEVLWLSDELGQPYVDAVRELLARKGITATPYTKPRLLSGASGVDAINADKGGCGFSLRCMALQAIPRYRRRSFSVLEIDDDTFQLPIDVLYRDDGDETVSALVEALKSEAAHIDMKDYD
jgi:DNA-binding transcriptional LysR family regulator